MLVVTLIVVAILTLLIFTLAFIAFHSLLNLEIKSIESGEQDRIILSEVEQSARKSKIWTCLNRIVSALLTLFICSSLVVAIIYKINDTTGVRFKSDNSVVLVIASDSMDGFYDTQYEKEMLDLDEFARKKQFKLGDILKFKGITEDEELELYNVYGYKSTNGKIIVHRLVEIKENGQYIFRGDNTPGRDSPVERSQIVYRYTNYKIEYLGNFILFSKSLFGLYSLISALIIYSVFELYISKYSRIINTRKKYLTSRKESGI